MNYNILNLYIIYTDILKKRNDTLLSSIEFLKSICKNNKIDININIINSPSAKFINDNVELFKDRIIDLNSLSNDIIEKERIYIEYSKFKINEYQVSNIEKHRNVYKSIMENLDSKSLFLIIEDDIVINNDNENVFNDFFKYIQLKENENKWDIILSSNADFDNDNLCFKDFRKHSNNNHIIISKGSYFINKKTASKLYDYFNTLKYSLKIKLSKYINDNNDLKVMVMNKYLFLEGSKIGLYPSSINNSNVLYFNNEYIRLTLYLRQDNITEEDLKNINNIYNNNKFKNNSDFLYTMGLIYFKYKDYNKSKQYLMEAIEYLQKNEGLISQYNEILNNCINIHQYDQTFIETSNLKQSKYI